MRRPVKWIILFVVGIFGIGGPLGLAEAKETFKDEAGRVIYTIDDEGMVSMFESSPTDITLSVTRGTREQMQPSLTEIIPNRVPAGNSATLKLRGKNLVGAKVKLSVPEIELGTYLSSPQIVEVPIHIPANVAPGEVLITLTTPIGSAKTGDTAPWKSCAGCWAAQSPKRCCRGPCMRLSSPVRSINMAMSGSSTGNSSGKMGCPLEKRYPCGSMRTRVIR